ncbi:cadherin-like protein 26 [Spea bombifrons]|uniref:cadherin-like protein 26 n=1 Tax=Spea bombifrons TaxID=233779 RepID=UPI00234BA770|nr:cadherin-like protein 26 [Spea bombifrons]
MKVPCLLLLLIFTVITYGEGKRKQEITQKKHIAKRSLIPADSLRPLRRTKRRWVLTTLVLEENDNGPFPKLAGDLFNDRAANYSIKYLISGPGVDLPPEVGLFTINDQTGQVFVHRPIDREKTPYFEICFDAADRLSGKIVDKSLIFNVEVKDKNDNAPEFSKSVYEVSLKETANLENPVLQVLAYDGDKQDTANSDITYSIVSQIPALPNVKFIIDPKSGLIRGQGCLNYEQSNTIKLLVSARDNGLEPLSSTATAILRIEDGNNQKPTFPTLNYNLTVREGEVKNDLLRIKVEDKDLPQTPAWRAKFKILSGNEKGNYNLTTDPKTNEGILGIVKPLDFEGTPLKVLKISVQNEEPLYICQNSKVQVDNTPQLNNVTVTITVMDINDAPIFHPATQIIREKEGLKSGSLLLRINATDPDRIPNRIRYEIAHDPAGWATVDKNTGEIRTLKELDRESPEVKDSVYTIIVNAIDDGDPPQTGSTTVLLYLSDLNDNTPELVLPYVERCQALNKQAFTVQAVDKDLDPFSGPFKFELGDNSRAVQDVWKIGRSLGDSVELLMVDDLPPGNYTVPLSFFDRQGSSSKQVLNIRVCGCPDGLTCEKIQPAAHSLGGGAIGVIVGVLLLFLLALCLLMCCFCGSGIKKTKTFLPNDEGNQTLINYNEEGGSVLSQTSPTVLIGNGNGNIGMTKNGVGVYASVSKQNSQNQNVAQLQGTQKEAWNQGSGFRLHAENSSYTPNSKILRDGTLNNKGLDIFVERVGEMVNYKLQAFLDEDEITEYNPRTYAYEGELERMDSGSSFSIADNDADLSFLNDLGPKFLTLGDICQTK